MGTRLHLGTRISALLLAVLPAACSWAQNAPVASRPLELSVFGAATGTYTNYEGGQNVAITAGVDLGIHPIYGIQTALEARGTYPIYHGHLDALENGLGGIRLGTFWPFLRLHPYASILYGRGEVTYNGKGRLNPAGTILYQRTNSSVLSFGGGGDYDITRWLAFKAEMLTQRYYVPVVASGETHAIATTFGLVYRFGYGGDQNPE